MIGARQIGRAWPLGCGSANYYIQRDITPRYPAILKPLSDRAHF